MVTLRTQGKDNWRRNLNEWDWDPLAFLHSPPADCYMCRVSCWLKVSHATSRRQLSGGQNHPDSKCRRNAKVLTRKTSWTLCLQDAAATKVGNESGTLYKTTTKAPWISSIWIFGVDAPLPCTSVTAVWIPRIHKLLSLHMLVSIFSSFKWELLSLENNLVCCSGLLFIISHQLSLGSDLCDLEFGCRTDFIFNQKDVDSEGAEPDKDGLLCCVAFEKSLCGYHILSV